MKEDMVYLMGRENTDYVKIGITNDIDRRLSQLKEKFKDIEILSIYVCPDRKNAVDLEKNLHSFLHHKRIQHEWFILQTDEIMALHEAIILFYRVRSHKFELIERENTFRNTPQKPLVWSMETINKRYYF